MVTGGQVLIGSCSGNFYALDQTTGAVRWRYDIRQDGNQTSFHGKPLLTGDLIVTGADGTSDSGHIYAFEHATGKVRWKHRLTKGVPGGTGVATDIVQSGQNICGVAFGDELLCLDRQSGKLRWTYRSGFNQNEFAWNQSPTANERHVFFGGLDGVVYALAAQSGRVVWRRDLGACISTHLLLAGGELYVGTNDGYLRRLRAENGAVLSALKLEDAPVNWLARANDGLLVFLQRSGDAGGARKLLSVDLALKNIRWQQTATGSWSVTRPHLWRDAVLAGNENGEVVAFRLQDGERQWTKKLSGTIRTISDDQGVLYVGTVEGTVYAWRPNQ